MVFSSVPFLYVFLPVVLLCCFVVPKRFKNLVLLAASLFFYYYGERAYTSLLLISSLSDYLHSLYIEKHRGTQRAKIALVSSIAVNLALLGFFKYADFLISTVNGLLHTSIPLLKVPLPIGISFFTFQTMSYTIDVYRGRVHAQKNLVTMGTFVCLFPQLVAGPIVRYSDIALELEQRSTTLDEVSAGARRFVVGLAKKVLVANAMGELCGLYRSAGEQTTLFALLYAAAFTIQIYYDFSGYSDMAIGLGLLFGFHFPENFNYPYLSRSVSEFWRRWHMTLGGWFRDYVYIPLGGNRVPRLLYIRNIFVVWLLTGLWHGAAWTFVLWGLWFCLLLLGEKFLWGKYLEKLPSLIRWAYAMFAVILSWVLFRSVDLGQAWAYLGAMFGQTTGLAQDGQALYYLLQFWPEWALALIAFLPVKRWAQSWLEARGSAGQAVALWVPRVLALGLLALSYLELVTGSFNPFIYFQF